MAIAEAKFKHARVVILESTEDLKNLGLRRVPPRPLVQTLLKVLMFLLGRRVETIADAAAPDTTALAWPQAGKMIDGPFIDSIHAGGFDPRETKVPKLFAYQKTEALRAQLESAGLPPPEELAAKEGHAIAALYVWVMAAMDLREALAVQRKRLGEEAAAAVAAEAEAAAAKAAADAEAKEAADAPADE